MNERHHPGAITDFPLAWRWTSPTHAVLSPAELAALKPCSSDETARIYERSLRFETADGLAPAEFETVLTQSADISGADGCSWLRAQAGDLEEQITVLWQRDIALRTTWELFTTRWDDFCYPSSDDVFVLPDSEKWVLRYHHEDIFFFGLPKHLTRRCS